MPRDLFLIDNLFDSLFFNIPKDLGKPPVDIVSFREERGKFHIQMALAGFSQDDLKVSFEGRVLKVEGDNSKNENLSSKFKSKFEKVWTIRDGFDLESAKVSFENGLLDICIEEKASKSFTKLLFGK